MDEEGGKYAAICFKDPSIRNWFKADREQLSEMGLEEFMNELRGAFLASDWQKEIEREVYALPQGSRPFLDWVTDLEMKNAQLPSTLQLSYARFHAELPSRLNEVLFRALRADPFRDAICKTPADEQRNFRAWVTHVKSLEELANARKAETAALVAEMLKSERSKAAKSSAKPSGNQSRGSSFTPRSGNSARLTQADRDILNRHKGCYRCRRYYVDHTYRNCPNNISSSPVSEEAALRARPKSQVASASAVEVQAPVSQPVSQPVVVQEPSISPNALAASLGQLTLQDDADTTEYVHFDEPHLSPSLLLVSPSNRTILAKTLIDHGCSTVLIKPEVVEKLGLVRNRMARAETMQTAVSGTFVVSEWVSFRVCTINKVWQSKCVYAKVAPGLCCDVILGLPFLSRNRLVTDAYARTVKSPEGLDIMHFANQASSKPKGSSMHSISHVSRFENQPIPLASRGRRPDLSPVEMACHVRKAIERIAASVSLDQYEQAMRTKYSDRFPSDLPHVNHLPTEPVHRILLKDSDQGFKSRQYPCPQKYRDAWRALLDEHLKAGRIRVSSSPYSSPAFLIPKANPTAPPR